MSVPIELDRLSGATTIYLDIIRDIDRWAEQAADLNRLSRPEYASLLDQLRDEIRTTQLPFEMGTVARIARVLAELLDEG